MGDISIDTYWFRDYLSNRTQVVKYQNETSKICIIEYGVPLGSTLGPVLFSIYVNDMSNLITEGLLIQYADDSQVLVWDSAKNFGKVLKKAEEILKKLKDYYLRNGLLINMCKTQYIIIGSREYVSRIDENICIKIDNDKISPSEKVNSLGILIDKYLSFQDHINDTARKTTGSLLKINRIKHFLDRDTRKLLLETLVFNRLFYCFKAWGNVADIHLQNIQKIQNFAARVAEGSLRKRDHVTPIMNQIGWLKIKYRYKYELGIMAFKIMNGLLPKWLFPLITRENALETTTRQSKNLIINNYRTTHGGRDVMVELAKQWNNLPKDMREIKNIVTFKRNIYNYYILKQRQQ